MKFCQAAHRQTAWIRTNVEILPVALVNERLVSSVDTLAVVISLLPFHGSHFVCVFLQLALLQIAFRLK